LKVGLITTIQDIHPRAEEIYWETLKKIATQLRFFKNIFTLNYDLFLYHIVMTMKDQRDKDHNLSRYSDCFWQEYDQDFNRFNSYQDYLRFRFVYYLHGALFLFRESLSDLKLLRKPGDETELVERVGKVIEGGRMPLFVCEGASVEKQETIGTSNYLDFALRKLRSSKENLVIFGTSLSRQDQHIIDAIDYIHKTNHRTKDLAISVHISTKSRETLEREIDETRNKFRNCNIYLFDSETLFDFLSIKVADNDKLEITKRMSLDFVRKHWPEIIESMKGEGEHGNLDAFLRSTCEPIEFHDSTLTIGFYHQFHLEYMQNRNCQKLLEKKISEILGIPVKLQYVIFKRRHTAEL
jgi:hypothetical protein